MGEPKVLNPIVSKQKLRKAGGSTYFLVPREWLEQHGNPTEVLFVADRGIKILPPEDTSRVYEKVTEVVEEI